MYLSIFDWIKSVFYWGISEHVQYNDTSYYACMLDITLWNALTEWPLLYFGPQLRPSKGETDISDLVWQDKNRGLSLRAWAHLV